MVIFHDSAQAQIFSSFDQTLLELLVLMTTANYPASPALAFVLKL